MISKSNIKKMFSNNHYSYRFYLLFMVVLLACTNPEVEMNPNENQKEVIVISEEDSNGILQIFLRDFDGSNSIQLTFNSTKSWMPAISPIGKKIVYVQNSSTAADIWIMNSDGTNNIKLTAGGINITPEWTPDSEEIYYSHSPNDSSNYKIYKMKLDGSDKTPLNISTGNFSDMVPTISPDGSKLAFTSNRSGIEKFEIWKVDVNGENLVRLTTTVYDEDIQANIQQKAPTWSPDGTKIALWRGVEMTELALDGSDRDEKIFNSWKICIMNTDGSELTAVDFGDDPIWSNDGVYLLHPDPINRDQNQNGEISIKIHLKNGNQNKTLFKTNRNFGRMDVGYISQ